ncbi:gamma-glutamyltransferase [Peribacillus sp. CSMR9]|uniref:gamma-glutamyltransferase n=1 Tax=Peribacillus sp. CSMR9 TaxID=2981350 RepID=UPI002955C839|nr:gamma-glutamyltransferase [Peribacillus sp. CSMR9]MDV7764020.1 gamma-glutamyltransferase [Peribacillus sp. CSMR9]
MVDGCGEILKECGTLMLAEVLEPAIQYAEDGFPIKKNQVMCTERNWDWLSKAPTLKKGVYKI